jgi:hypothetical protein
MNASFIGRIKEEFGTEEGDIDESGDINQRAGQRTFSIMRGYIALKSYRENWCSTLLLR